MNRHHCNQRLSFRSAVPIGSRFLPPHFCGGYRLLKIEETNQGRVHSGHLATRTAHERKQYGRAKARRRQLVGAASLYRSFLRANRLPGSAATPSRIAAAFDKQHFHVMRAIRVLLDQMPPEDHASHFGLMMVEVDIGKGATRRDPAYRISRDGFGKQHSHVKRAIRALLEQMPPEDHQSIFWIDDR